MSIVVAHMYVPMQRTILSSAIQLGTFKMEMLILMYLQDEITTALRKCGCYLFSRLYTDFSSKMFQPVWLTLRWSHPPPLLAQHRQPRRHFLRLLLRSRSCKIQQQTMTMFVKRPRRIFFNKILVQFLVRYRATMTSEANAIKCLHHSIPIDYQFNKIN